MINKIKNNFRLLYKNLIYKFFFILYKKIDRKVHFNDCRKVEVKKISFEGSINYKLFKIKDCRLYTDTIHDAAFIIDNQIIDGPSFQLRNNRNASANENIVFNKGTPKLKKNFRGNVLSLLTGGGGNENYWHWFFDVLPRLWIAEKKINLKNINYFLFPNLKRKFQIETIKILKIPFNNCLSSKKYKHIFADNIFTVDHPYNFLNEPLKDSLDIPKWICSSLKKNFLTKNNVSKLDFPKKFYIDRSDSTSGHKNKRIIVNEHEVINFLKKKGFSILTLSDLKFVDQVNLFNKAEHIVGLHGAGFANLVFCEPNTKVVEFQSDTAGDIIKNLSLKNNLKYENISIKPKTILQNNQLGDIEIPIKTLERMFN
tara:strand:+ start:5013 stop:6122 length:1110 start_codon:yes stop_codon:yes gene_type:complete